MNMNYENSSIAYKQKLDKMRAEAKQGDFYFANFFINSGEKRKAPIFVVGNDNDAIDVVICICTSQPSRGDWDKRVYLLKPTYVRTNKLYTIRREQLIFKIDHTLTAQKFNEIMDSVKAVFN